MTRVKRAKIWMVTGLMSAALSCPVWAMGITKKTCTASTSVKKNTSANYALTLKYDTTMYNIALPTSCQLGLELPTAVFKSVKFQSGSFKMSFAKKTGAVTGEQVYQCYKSFRVTGVATKGFSVKAAAVNKAGKSGHGNMGTGKLGLGIKLNEWNKYFTVKSR